jgi:iron complex transport system ATP-binding protein
LVIDGLSLSIPPGHITAMIGANGSGKSTLLRGLARLLKPRAGSVLLDGESIARLSSKTLARQLGLLSQAPLAPQGLIVEDLVARGRYPHQRLFRQWSRGDEDAVNRALQAAGVTDLRTRLVDELSGGQRQRAWIALALAQEAPIMLLDEPTTYLDLAHQGEVLDLIAVLNREQGRTIVMVLHDINQACRYADHVIALRGGACHAAGAPRQVITEQLIEDVFDTPCRVIDDPITGTPLCLTIPATLLATIHDQNTTPAAVAQATPGVTPDLSATGVTDRSEEDLPDGR